MIAEERSYLKANGVKDDEIDLYLIAMDQVNLEQMTNALTWIKETYGSPLGYITEELGVTDEEIGLLRDRFLTD